MNEEEERLPLASRLFDQIDAGLQWTTDYIADAAEDKEGWTDDVVRGTLGTLQWIGNLPVLKQIGQLEEGVVGGVRNLAERQDVIDPRLFTYGTRLGLAFVGDKGVRKVVKVGKVAAKTRKINQLVRGKNILGQPLKAQTPIVGGIQEQFTSEGLKGVLLQQLDNTNPNFIEKFGKKVGKQVEQAVEKSKSGIQRVLGRESDNIKVKPGFEIFALNPSEEAAKILLFDSFARKSGYKAWADFKRKVINQYPSPLAEEELLYKFLKESPGVGQIEHKIAKASKIKRLEDLQSEFPNYTQAQLTAELARKSQNTFDMDWYWNKEYIGRDGKWYTDGLNKGDRDSWRNTLPTYDTRQIYLKNVVEKVGYGGEGKKGYMLAGKAGRKVERVGTEPGILWQGAPKDRLIVDIDVIDKRAALIDQPGTFGNIVIKRAKNKSVIGEIGDYMDALYPADRTKKYLLRMALREKGIKNMEAWRAQKIRERLEIIVRDAPKLPAKSNVEARSQAILEGMLNDMTNLFAEFPFLKTQRYDEIMRDISAYADQTGP